MAPENTSGESWYGFVTAPTKAWLQEVGDAVEGYCPFCTPTVQLEGEFHGSEEDALLHFQNRAMGHKNVWVGFAG